MITSGLTNNPEFSFYNKFQTLGTAFELFLKLLIIFYISLGVSGPQFIFTNKILHIYSNATKISP